MRNGGRRTLTINQCTAELIKQVFGLIAPFTLEQLNEARKVSVRRLHPDVNKSLTAHEEFIQCQELYEIICENPELATTPAMSRDAVRRRWKQSMIDSIDDYLKACKRVRKVDISQDGQQATITENWSNVYSVYDDERLNKSRNAAIRNVVKDILGFDPGKVDVD